MCKSIPILILELSWVGPIAYHLLFDEQDITCGSDYQFVLGLSHLLDLITPNSRQMVFVSHDEHQMNGHDVAYQIKELNPKAIVIATTIPEFRCEDRPGSKLDGVIYVGVKPHDLRTTLAKAFLAGTSREQLIKLMR